MAMVAAVSSGGVWVIVAERGCKCAFPKVGREGRERLVEGSGVLRKVRDFKARSTIDRSFGECGRATRQGDDGIRIH